MAYSVEMGAGQSGDIPSDSLFGIPLTDGGVEFGQDSDGDGVMDAQDLSETGGKNKSAFASFSENNPLGSKIDFSGHFEEYVGGEHPAHEEALKLAKKYEKDNTAFEKWWFEYIDGDRARELAALYSSN